MATNYIQPGDVLEITNSTGSAVASVPEGARLRVKKTSSDAKKITLDGDASEQIGGGTTYASIDADGDTALFVNTGSAWQLIDSTIA